jgi:hypothetical protein
MRFNDRTSTVWQIEREFGWEEIDRQAGAARRK